MKEKWIKSLDLVQKALDRAEFFRSQGDEQMTLARARFDLYELRAYITAELSKKEDDKKKSDEEQEPDQEPVEEKPPAKKAKTRSKRGDK